MSDRPRWRLTRNIEAPLLFESFFVAAVASFLGIRGFLMATGFPRVGSGGIHVAHMLWGGLLLLAAVLLLLGFLDHSVRHAAAIVAGLGFGTFIDEIGKFVTADNDYFFRPAIALIYLVFVVVFFVGRALVGRRRVTGDEALANALDLIASTAARGLEPEERARIRDLIELAEPADPRTVAAFSYLAAIPSVPDQDGPIDVAVHGLAAAYARVMAIPWVDQALVVGMVAYALLAVGGVMLAAVSTGQDDPAGLGVAGAMQVGSTIAGALLVLRGALALRQSRLEAYHWFQRGLLVWIFVTQVFVFYTFQLGGLLGLAVDLLAYGSIRYAIGRERAAERASRAAQSEGIAAGG